MRGKGILDDDKHVISGLRPKRKVDSVDNCPNQKNNLKQQHISLLNTPIVSNPLDRLCESLLSWEILNEIKNPINKQYDQVPLCFRDYSQYLKTWEPLLMEEIKSSILSTISSLLSNQVITGKINMECTDIVDNGSLLLKFDCNYSTEKFNNLSKSSTNERNSISSMDLVLISKDPILFPINSSSVINRQLNEQRHFLALVSHSRSDNKKCQMKVHRSFLSLDMIKNTSLANPLNTDKTLSDKNYSIESKISATYKKTSSQMASSVVNTIHLQGLHFVVLDSLVSYWREFLALHDMRTSVCLVNSVLQPFPRSHIEPSPATTSDIKEPPELLKPSLPGLTDRFLDTLRSRLNTSQMKAVYRSVDGAVGFTLIQGPPGTGKTSTIIGILNAIHTKEYNAFYSSCISTVLGPEGMRCRRAPTETSLWTNMVASLSKAAKPHILVTAPSNVAVDNVIARIMEKGFIDSKAETYYPSILRFGAGKSNSVQAVSLEEIMEKEQLAELHDREAKVVSANLQQQMDQQVRQIFTAQSYLLNLRTAFVAHPLPQGWELRVALDTAAPYWVDHWTKTASNSPPPPPSASSVRTYSGNNFTLETLPEYSIHCSQIVVCMERLFSLHLHHSRCRLRTDQGGGGGAAARKALEASVLDSAHILFSTANGSGHPSLEGTSFSVVIVDEAAQCSEMAALVPLRRAHRKCVLVGDPQQLSGTVFSEAARRCGYGRSLFQRLVDDGHAFTLLDTQYRMAPAISAFPSKAFYNSQLKDGDNVTAASYLSAATTETPLPGQSQSLQSLDSLTAIQPFMFFNLLSSRDMSQQAASSLSNPQEAILCVRLLQLLARRSSETGGPIGSVGIISPYNEQISEIRRQLISHNLITDFTKNSKKYEKKCSTFNIQFGQTYLDLKGDPLECQVELNTVDGFQGREKDFIIISCVRANSGGNIGFLSDARRMNVGLTRGRFGLFVVGFAATLRKHTLWSDLVQHAEKTHCFYNVASTEFITTYSCKLSSSKAVAVEELEEGEEV